MRVLIVRKWRMFVLVGAVSALPAALECAGAEAGPAEAAAWCARAIEERYLAIGRRETVSLAAADAAALETARSHIARLCTNYVRHTLARDGRFDAYFRGEGAPAGGALPVAFPTWAPADLCAEAGVAPDWLQTPVNAMSRPGADEWAAARRLLQQLRWTSRLSTDKQNTRLKVTSANGDSFSAAREAASKAWAATPLRPGGGYCYAAAICAIPGWRVIAYRADARPYLRRIPRSMSHQASWYLRFEQRQGYTEMEREHPLFAYDESEGAPTDQPHVVFVEELPPSNREFEIGSYPFADRTTRDPTQWAREPTPPFQSFVQYTACTVSHWLLKWDVPGGFKYL